MLRYAASFGICCSTNRKYRWLQVPATKINLQNEIGRTNIRAAFFVAGLILVRRQAQKAGKIAKETDVEHALGVRRQFDPIDL